MKTYFVSRSVANLRPFRTKSKYVVPLVRSKRSMPLALSAAGWLSRYSDQKAASSLGCGRGIFLDRDVFFTVPSRKQFFLSSN